MQRSDFLYALPRHLIAQHPSPRGSSRLLCVRGGAVEDRMFSSLPALLAPGDLLVFNDTRVMRARLLGRKASGGRVEVLVERILSPHLALAHVRSNKPLKEGGELLLEGCIGARVEGRAEGCYLLRFAHREPLSALLERYGRLPLPPYIQRPPEPEDEARYQTVYARKPGAVAAPTAGLHFTPELLEALRARGIATAFITLHVGAGTFQPVRSERLEAHIMHRERLEVAPEVCAAVEAARARGGRVVAVGTTVVRALETASRGGGIAPFSGETDLFIRPGHRFRSVDALITNFHLPGSTLLMLVCALGGYREVMAAYRHAVERGYRFFSYGDAMWVEPCASRS